MVVAVVSIDVAVVVGHVCETDRYCNTKCGGFVDKRDILETLKIKWKTKMAKDEDTRGNDDANNRMVMPLLVEADEEVSETTKDKNASLPGKRRMPRII